MTLSEWARRVDADIIAASPGLRFALRGRTAFKDDVPASAFEEPHWGTKAGFVYVRSLGKDRQLCAMFIPAVTEDVPFGESDAHRLEREKRFASQERFYDLSETGAREAAAGIVRFLDFGGLPY